MGLSRQEYWSGLPFPSPGELPDPGIKLTSQYPCLHAKLLQSYPALRDPVDCSPPGSSVRGVLQAIIMSGLPLLQGTFLTQESNQRFLHLLHCRQILYPLSHLGSPLCSSSSFKSHRGDLLKLKGKQNSDEHTINKTVSNNY